jgi:hypothetical protein
MALFFLVAAMIKAMKLKAATSTNVLIVKKTSVMVGTLFQGSKITLIQ